jgi:hypothetical protein
MDNPQIQIPGPGSAMALATAVSVYIGGEILRTAVKYGHNVTGGVMWFVFLFPILLSIFTLWIEALHIGWEKLLPWYKKNSKVINNGK